MILLHWQQKFQTIFKMKKWVKLGMIWGVFMFVIMTFIWPLIDGDTITLRSVLIAIPIWAITGLIFGYTMRKNFKKES